MFIIERITLDGKGRQATRVVTRQAWMIDTVPPDYRVRDTPDRPSAAGRIWNWNSEIRRGFGTPTG